ncbi:Presenilin spe-4, putative [Brugia malayi]|uniref:Presenilin spe-4, putative n=1 Tax=Brugia malayi TaxID=6279 RepID=A0A4E9FG55_BRUMA|nr:Presenilin spe-4, putative [Brugia malayi]VIO95396.1 Presenilin spe-4, putative [Brugia malayi]
MKSSTGWLELSKLASSQKIGLHSNGTLLTSFDLYFLLFDDSNETPQRMFFTVIALSDKDLFKAIGFQTAPPILTTLTVITYGTIGILVFFTKKTLYLHQFFVICNCSLVSVFYLRMFSTHTEWFVLVCIIIWDAFAVLAPIGPLRRISEKAHEYSDQVSKAITSQLLDIISIATTAFSLQVLRSLMFTAEDRNDERREEIEAKSKHIQQRKALGRKSNICDETIRKICTKLGTTENKRKKRNLKSTML